MDDAAVSLDDSSGGTNGAIVISTSLLECLGQLIYEKVNIVYDIPQGQFMLMV